MPSPPPPSPPSPAARGPRLAIVIDDLGYDLNAVRGLLEVDAPITLAVLPHLRHSRRAAQMAYDSGREVILHLPMEPRNSRDHDPGRGALLTSMSERDIVDNLLADLDAVPHLSGVNNHMGSRFTENERLMELVLRELKERGFFFLDSRTSGRTVAARVARRLGLRTVERSVFLDNERDRSRIRARLREAVRLARRNGSAVAIGHPYSETIEVLKEEVPALARQGVTVVRLSSLAR
ncbi:MAG TPA: divergent polysaccharide deacetylase family protein [Deltaproteobacteria bacterium]|nr:divergent polysaccharide deacetylase family protein [Deltaproteobacteria bacterium]